MTWLPSGNTTRLIAVAGWWMPPLAIVAYASAISSGDTPIRRPPITSAGLPSSGEVMPIACAVWSSFDQPRSAASWANTVLSETVVARVMLMSPW